MRLFKSGFTHHFEDNPPTILIFLLIDMDQTSAKTPYGIRHL